MISRCMTPSRLIAQVVNFKEKCMFDFYWEFLEAMTGTEVMTATDCHDADYAYCAGGEL